MKYFVLVVLLLSLYAYADIGAYPPSYTPYSHGGNGFDNNINGNASSPDTNSDEKEKEEKCRAAQPLSSMKSKAGSDYKQNFIAKIEQSIPTWTKQITAKALQIFCILWGFETLVQLVFKNILGNDMRKLPVYLITRIAFGAFFSFAMLKPDIYFGIISYFANVAGTIKFNVIGNHVTGVDPGDVFDVYHRWYVCVYTPVQSGANWGQIVINGIFGIIYLLCCCSIALMIILLDAEIYFSLAGGLILTGFAGSSWTFSLWNKYLDTVIAFGIRILVFGLLYGMLIGIADYDTGNGMGPDRLIADVINAILITCCLWVVPRKVSSIVAGTAQGNSLKEGIGAAISGYLGVRSFIKYFTPDSPKLQPSGSSRSDSDGDGSGKSSPPNNYIINNNQNNHTPPAKPMPPGWKDESGGNT